MSGNPHLRCAPWIVLVTVLGLAGCAGQASWQGASPTVEVVANWLRKPACPPPCWESITPGSTTFQEALTTLESLPGVRVTAPPYEEPDLSAGTITWDMDTTVYGYAESDDDGTVIQRIALIFGNQQTVPLGDIMEMYGQPDYVRFFDTREPYNELHILFTNHGLVLDVTSRSLGSYAVPRVKIGGTTEVRGILFIARGEESYRSAFPRAIVGSGKRMEWHGFGEYP